MNFGLAHLDRFAWVGGFSSAPNTRKPAELVPDPPPPYAPVQRPDVHAVWAGASSLPNPASSAMAPVGSELSVSPRLHILGKVLSGLFTLATYALDRDRGRSSWLLVLSDLTGSRTKSMGRSTGRCRSGSLRRGGRGYGSGGGRNARHRDNKRSRMA